MRAYLKSLRRDFEAERQEVNEQLDEIREENYRLRQKISDLESELAEVKEATDLLRIVKEQSKPDAQREKAALILSLKRKAERREERHGKRPVASIDRKEAQHVLGHPDLDRTTIYKRLKKAAEMVDGKVLDYDGGELKINLQAGELSESDVTGFTGGNQ